MPQKGLSKNMKNGLYVVLGLIAVVLVILLVNHFKNKEPMSTTDALPDRDRALQQDVPYLPSSYISDAYSSFDIENSLGLGIWAGIGDVRRKTCKNQFRKNCNKLCKTQCTNEMTDDCKIIHNDYKNCREDCNKKIDVILEDGTTEKRSRWDRHVCLLNCTLKNNKHKCYNNTEKSRDYKPNCYHCINMCEEDCKYNQCVDPQYKRFYSFCCGDKNCKANDTKVKCKKAGCRWFEEKNSNNNEDGVCGVGQKLKKDNGDIGLNNGDNLREQPLSQNEQCVGNNCGRRGKKTISKRQYGDIELNNEGNLSEQAPSQNELNNEDKLNEQAPSQKDQCVGKSGSCRITKGQYGGVGIQP